MRRNLRPDNILLDGDLPTAVTGTEAIGSGSRLHDLATVTVCALLQDGDPAASLRTSLNRDLLGIRRLLVQCPVPLDLSHRQVALFLRWPTLSGKTSCATGRPSAS